MTDTFDIAVTEETFDVVGNGAIEYRTMLGSPSVAGADSNPLSADGGLSMTDRAAWDAEAQIFAMFTTTVGATAWVETLDDNQVFLVTRNSTPATDPGPWWIEDDPITTAANARKRLDGSVGTSGSAAWSRQVGSIDGGATYIALGDESPNLSDLNTKMGYLWPDLGNKPTVHEIKGVSFDYDPPGFFDGSATHMGGINLANNSPYLIWNGPNAGVWQFQTGSAAIRATALGPVPASEVGPYDILVPTAGDAAARVPHSIIGTPTQRGLHPDPDTGFAGMVRAEPMARVFTPTLIAQSFDGTNLVVLEADGTTTTVARTSLPAIEMGVLVVADATYLTFASGVLKQTEDYTTAPTSLWVAAGLPTSGLHAGAVVGLSGGVVTVLTRAAGSGTGDVVGPSSATDGAPALFDSTTGKLLKVGATNTANGLAKLNGIGVLPDSLLGTAIARNSEVDTAIGVHAAATDPHGDRGYADSLFAANDALVFKGVIDCSTNPNYPAADAGHTYRVSVAGKVGGASGANVEIGDMLLCITDGSSSGTQAAVGSRWGIVQSNIDGAVVGPSGGVTDGQIVLWDTTSGRLVKAASVGIADLQPIDSDLTAIAALTTTSFGRDVLTKADAAALRSYIGVGYAILADTTLGADAATISASWSGNYDDLIAVLIGRSTSTAGGTVTVTGTLNSDGATAYYTTAGSGGTSYTAGVVSGSQTNTDRTGRIRLEISNIGSARHTIVTSYLAANSGSNASTSGAQNYVYSSTTRVTSVQFATAAGNFASGARLYVLGRA